MIQNKSVLYKDKWFQDQRMILFKENFGLKGDKLDDDNIQEEIEQELMILEERLEEAVQNLQQLLVSQ